MPRDAYMSAHLGKREVKGHHDPELLATLADPDFKTLEKLGFKPGKPVPYYWRQLALTLLSPAFHWTFSIKRLRANVLQAPLHRRLAAIIWLATIIGLTAMAGAWKLFFFAWVLPVTAGVNISILGEFISEHAWLEARLPGETLRQWHERKTFNRLGAIPNPGKGFQWWLTFIVLMLCNLWVRVAINPVGLPLHPVHHAQPTKENWAMSAYTPRSEIPGEAVWGFRNAISRSFCSLSQANPDDL